MEREQGFMSRRLSRYSADDVRRLDGTNQGRLGTLEVLRSAVKECMRNRRFWCLAEINT
jgi:hypothetical protein